MSDEGSTGPAKAGRYNNQRMTPEPNSPSLRSRTSRLWLAFGGLLVAVLLAGVFTLGSLNVPFAPDTRTEFIVLFALSTFNIVALFIFGLILVRSLFRLWAERRAHQLGARFKTKMVLGAIGISLLPLIFMFFISYALMNRTLNKWFSRPLEGAVAQSEALLDELEKSELGRLRRIAYDIEERWSQRRETLPARAIQLGADAAWILGPRDDYVAGSGSVRLAEVGNSKPEIQTKPLSSANLLEHRESGAELWVGDGEPFLAFRLTEIDSTKPIVGKEMDGKIVDFALAEGSLVVARRLPPSYPGASVRIRDQFKTYQSQHAELRTFKNQILLTLALFTVLLMFSSMWFALFLSKQVTGPIQALAQGTQEVSKGNFGYQVEVQARDELGVLVHSFNQMTRQLADSRQQLDAFTRSLQQAVTEIEERRKLMETILENIPTAVLSLDSSGGIARANRAVERIFGDGARSRKTLPELLGNEAARVFEQQMRKALRMGTASTEVEFSLPASGSATPGRMLHTAVTVSALGTRRSNPGFVVVIDDLTELLRAQKASAWQSVAQRIAHEIRNPLTPIQLSAQRLMRYLDRSTEAQPTAREPELAALIGECAGLIEREVATLKSLVDEFAQFARFPVAKLAPLDANGLVSSALEVFTGRLDGVTVRAQLDAGLPLIKADAELLRRVLVNLIDNAAEALEGCTVRELTISTRTCAHAEAVEILVADSGHGISPEDKEKLFLPHFSTRNRGTGLGLAIAGRIVAEHGGSIRAEDNSPVGARFVIKLPVAETVAKTS